MEFSKLHALGNDFLVAKAGEAGSSRRSRAVIARGICDRHCGVGADGMIFYQPTHGDGDADFSALIFNADGSKAEMSGNGMRCLAASLIHCGEHTGKIVRIRTVSGIKKLTLIGRNGLSYRFECSMGHPVTDPAEIPARIDSGGQPVLDYSLAIESETVRVSLCSMGNPHCSTFWPDVAGAPVETLGPALETHAIFPNRTNVEFIQVLDRHHLRVRFWERGVGRTLASGTGSSAAAVAAILRELAESPLTVETELGSLRVDWQHGQELILTGPADFVCSGDYPAGDQGAGA